MKYFEVQQDNKQVAKPNFLSFQNNLLFLSNQRISREHAEALAQYLELVKEIPEKRLFRLVIESCGMKDDALSLML